MVPHLSRKLPLAAAVAVWLPAPRYAGATKERLAEQRAAIATSALVRAQVAAQMEADRSALGDGLRQYLRRLGERDKESW